MPTPPVQAVHEAALVLLRGIEYLNVFDGEVPTSPPLDPDGRVHPYAVLHTGGGRGYSDRLTTEPGDLADGFQVTCAGGDVERCLWAVDRVRPLFVGRRIVGTSPADGGRVVETTPESMTVRRDDDKDPPRHYLPLLFQLNTSST